MHSPSNSILLCIARVQYHSNYSQEQYFYRVSLKRIVCVIEMCNFLTLNVTNGSSIDQNKKSPYYWPITLVRKCSFWMIIESFWWLERIFHWKRAIFDQLVKKMVIFCFYQLSLRCVLYSPCTKSAKNTFKNEIAIMLSPASFKFIFHSLTKDFVDFLLDMVLVNNHRRNWAIKLGLPKTILLLLI